MQLRGIPWFELTSYLGATRSVIAGSTQETAENRQMFQSVASAYRHTVGFITGLLPRQACPHKAMAL